MHEVSFVVPRNFKLMSLAALSAFELANLHSDKQVYEVDLLSEFGGPVRSTFDMSLETRPFRHDAYDTVMLTVAPRVGHRRVLINDSLRSQQKDEQHGVSAKEHRHIHCWNVEGCSESRRSEVSAENALIEGKH